MRSTPRRTAARPPIEESRMGVPPARSALEHMHPALPWVFQRLEQVPGGRRKVQHSVRVMNAVHGPTARLVAALHDVLEMTNLRLQDLAQLGFSTGVLRRVDLLTRRPRERYFSYIRRLLRDPIARKVKLADLADQAVRLRRRAPHSLRAQRKLHRNTIARQMILAATAQRERLQKRTRAVRHSAA